MEFFSDNVAFTLQYFTFPLELIGLTLATIEVRYPGKARAIAQYITDRVTSAQLDEQAFAISHPRIWKLMLMDNSDLGFSIPIRLQLIGLGFSGIFFLGIISMGILSMAHGEKLIATDLYLMVGNLAFGGGIVLGFILPLLMSAYGVLFFVDRFVEGRAVGTLGIILAGFGVLGEAYQFTTQLVV